jgi:hypothetical protein
MTLEAAVGDEENPNVALSERPSNGSNRSAGPDRRDLKSVICSVAFIRKRRSGLRSSILHEANE